MQTIRQKPTFETQSIHLANVINARELGGYEINGKRIRYGRLIRGGSLANASENDLRRLKERYRVTNIFDFRTEGEVKAAPDKDVEGASNMWLPAIDPNTEKMTDRCLPKEAYSRLEDFVVEQGHDPLVQSIAHRLYSDMVRNEYTQLQYAAFLQTIVENEKGSFYWHCSQGKDRTGLGAAFLLAALGADRELILDDFAISNEFYSDLVKKLSSKAVALGGGEKELAVIRTFIGVNVDYFSECLDIIENEYGGMDSYLRNQLILTDEDIAKLRRNLLE